MAGAPLGNPLGGVLKQGDRLLVFYETDVVWHARLLLALVDQNLWVILTPDGDIYAEEVSDGNMDWSAWRVWPMGSPVPFGVDPALIHDFHPPPADAVLQQLFQEGCHHAHQERVRLGINNAAPAPHGAGGGVMGVGGPVVPVGGGGGGPAVPNLAGGGGPAMAADGHAALAAAINVGGADPAAAHADDARTLAISRDVDGLRFKEFRVAVQESKPTEFSDWPISGPRTVKYVLSQMLDHGGSAMGHHQAWRVACKLQPTDAPAMEHEAWSKVLQTLMTYDQVDVTNLAGGEMIVRALQRIEEKHKFKLSAVDDAGEGALFMGSSSGSRVGSIICPKLTEWIGSEMQKEALVAKERRKAREERALARKGDKDGAASK